MNNEYRIFNATAIQKRIEELEKQRDEYAFNPNRTDDCYRYNSIIKVLKEILFQSTPLIPEIEKGVGKGLSICLTKKDWAYGISGSVKQDIKDYISNLKLDI